MRDKIYHITQWWLIRIFLVVESIDLLCQGFMGKELYLKTFTHIYLPPYLSLPMGFVLVCVLFLVVYADIFNFKNKQLTHQNG